MTQKHYYSTRRWLRLVLLSVISTFSLAKTNTPARFSGVNDVQFHQQQHNNAFAGNGFLIEHKNKLYAVTVKHVLFEAKTPEMTHVWLADDLSQWRIHPLDDPEDYVQLGRLINADKEEEINGNILQKDWLLFEVEKNMSSLMPLKIRQTPLKPGEKVRAIGCSYAQKENCSQDIYEGQFKAYAPHNLRVDLGDTPIAQLRGLSGSPVIDSDDRLVGIVSNVLPARGEAGLDFAPARLDYLLSILPR